ncbi:MAG TPA: hypothetical protein VLD18_15310, partial [Verrucomicrobiae bacterium]|nr:hypothetical protein [Verrucomicrobiae bacterium]
MRRSLTILSLAVVGLAASDRGAAVRGAEVTTTVYVGRHFEVRDHDQPVKYVFNDESRVARITGSLSNRDRIQRFRLQPGWNLISLAVTAINLAGQLEQFTTVPGPPISALYRWRPSTRDF